MSAANFRGGASSPQSPRRLRAKYTLRTNLRFMLRGFRPAGGKFAQAQIYTVRKSRTVFIHAAQRTGAWMALLPTVTFGAKCAAPPVGLHRTNPHSAAVKEQQPQTALIRVSVRTQPSNNGCSQNNCGGLSAKERKKAFMKRNSFIEMAKLHDLSGRITYISSHAKQEHLYEVYTTEPDRAFWRELAKCNQEEFEKTARMGSA